MCTESVKRILWLKLLLQDAIFSHWDYSNGNQLLLLPAWYLDKAFRNIWIDTRGHIDWLLRSLDLCPLDFFVKSHKVEQFLELLEQELHWIINLLFIFVHTLYFIKQSTVSGRTIHVFSFWPQWCSHLWSRRSVATSTPQHRYRYQRRRSTWWSHCWCRSW